MYVDTCALTLNVDAKRQPAHRAPRRQGSGHAAVAAGKV